MKMFGFPSFDHNYFRINLLIIGDYSISILSWHFIPLAQLGIFWTQKNRLLSWESVPRSANTQPGLFVLGQQCYNHFSVVSSGVSHSAFFMKLFRPKLALQFFLVSIKLLIELYFNCYFSIQSRFVGYLERVFTKLNGRLPPSRSYRIKNIKIDGISGTQTTCTFFTVNKKVFFKTSIQ